MSPLVHRTDRHDADAAFKRYQDLTGDTEATLRRIAARHTVAYCLEAEGFSGEWTGAASIVASLDAFCRGYEAGLKDGRDLGSA